MISFQQDKRPEGLVRGDGCKSNLPALSLQTIMELSRGLWSKGKMELWTTNKDILQALKKTRVF